MQRFTASAGSSPLQRLPGAGFRSERGTGVARGFEFDTYAFSGQSGTTEGSQFVKTLGDNVALQGIREKLGKIGAARQPPSMDK